MPRIEHFACPRCGAIIEMPTPDDLRGMGRLRPVNRVICLGPPLPVWNAGPPPGETIPPLPVFPAAHTVLFAAGIWQDGTGKRLLKWKDPTCPV